MCGIAGVADTGERVAPGLAEAMAATLTHRGPDSSGAFAADGVALGAARLAVIDVEGGDQPIASEDGSVVVVMNGEVYNHAELRDELAALGHAFRTRSDTEVVAHLYEELGDGCLERLRGMFALALWDRRRRRLLLARDRVGKKPLFYAERGGRLWFASEPRAILATGEVPADVDPRAIDLYLHHQCVPAPHSAFAAIRKLPPAHTLSWRDGRSELRRWWKLSYADRAPEGDPAELVREGLLEATRLRLRSDRPVGALLSGGMDSSAVVAAMAHAGASPVRTFSIGFHSPSFDESASARAVAGRYGTEHEELVLDARAMELLPRMAWHYGEPFADSSALACFALCELAGREVTVALNGDGGDEALGGYARHVRPPAANPARRYAERRANGYFGPQQRAALYEPAFAADVAGDEWRELVERPYRESDAPGPAERIVDVDTRTYLPNDLLVKMDIAAMAHSLETRSPFCDHVLLELAAGLPMEEKVRGGVAKALLKDAVRPWLGDTIVDRPKQGFMVPVAEWLDPGLCTDLLLDPVALGRGMFRERRLRELIDGHRAGIGSHQYRLWTLVMLELWFRTYVDRAGSPGPIALSAV